MRALHNCTLKKRTSIKINFLCYWVWEVVGNFRNLCWCYLYFTRKQASIWKVNSLYRRPRNTHQNQHHLTGDITQGICWTNCVPSDVHTDELFHQDGKWRQPLSYFQPSDSLRRYSTVRYLRIFVRGWTAAPSIVRVYICLTEWILRCFGVRGHLCLNKIPLIRQLPILKWN